MRAQPEVIRERGLLNFAGRTLSSATDPYTFVATLKANDCIDNDLCREVDVTRH